MIVCRSTFDSVLEVLRHTLILSLDTETTGLRPYHGDRLFSIIIATETDAYYFNFQPYPGLPADQMLTPSHLKRLGQMIGESAHLWILTNAKYDMAILANEGITLRGDIHCTRAQGRVEYNERLPGSFDLGSAMARIGLTKGEGPEKWCKENEGGRTYVIVPGRKEPKEILHFDRVPIDIIVPYALNDACGSYAVGMHQIAEIRRQSEETPEGLPKVDAVMVNERRLTQTVYRMEREGALVDLDFCRRAAQFEDARGRAAAEEFQRITGHAYKESPKLFEQVFESEKPRWVYGEPTKKGTRNPSFNGDVLPLFEHPAAKLVMDCRDAKAKSNFYTGFIYHADKNGRVHPNFNPEGAAHGRFSSSDPNFQNLKSDEDEEVLKQEFVVRRAIVPPPGFLICAIDYSTMEYRFMLELACRYIGRLSPLAALIVGGADYHQATADLATEKSGHKVTRGQAKTSNFLTLYGGGDAKLASQLKVPLDVAKKIRAAIREAAPEIALLQRQMMKTAETRGYVRNWLGRRCYFPNPEFAYVAPNYLVAGGCADVVKVAMNQIDELLLGYESKMVLTIHDELVFYIKLGEEFLIQKIKTIMETVFKSEYVPLVCSAYTSTKSLADLEEWKAA